MRAGILPLMQDGVIQFRVEDAIGMISFLIQMACVLGALFIGYGRLDQRIKSIEAHSDEVQKIGPMEARFMQFERGIETRLESIERAVRESASATQQLALAFANRRSA